MGLKEQITEDIKTAMRSKDEVALRALRAIKSAILLAETAEGATGPLTPEAEIQLLTKQVKQRKDSIASFKAGGREDLAAAEEEELKIIERYLPKALTTEEIEAEIKAIIAETGAASIKDMGKVMKTATSRFAGRADGKIVSDMVKKLLGG
ncbi:MAG: GatB/YqeY domain-containing protein [Bacteroidia bacterium]|nr:GatB/YqeY domain-containing protein [Bacteroidia bacterium]